jgi:hypothetical protein
MLKKEEEYLVKESKRLDALRLREEDRAKRFTNAKTRTIGIDVESLGKQTERRRLECEEEKEKLADNEN